MPFLPKYNLNVGMPTQVPNIQVYYGPDTYMGQNLAALFTSLAQMPDEEVQKLHPGAALPRPACPHLARPLRISSRSHH